MYLIERCFPKFIGVCIFVHLWFLWLSPFAVKKKRETSFMRGVSTLIYGYKEKTVSVVRNYTCLAKWQWKILF